MCICKGCCEHICVYLHVRKRQQGRERVCEICPELAQIQKTHTPTYKIHTFNTAARHAGTPADNEGGVINSPLLGSHACVRLTYTDTKIAHVIADACGHDKHSRHSGGAGDVVKTEWLCTCLHITAGGAASLGPGSHFGAASEGVGPAFQVKEVMTCPSSRPINQPAQRY